MRFYQPFFLVLTLLLCWNMPGYSAEKSNAVLESISFQGDAEKGENVSFKLNGEHLPKIFAIQGENPRVVFDFLDTRCSNQVNRSIDSKGKLVKKIRVGIHNDQAPKIRVVVDLAPNGEYQYKQHFKAQDNTLLVTIFSTAGDVAHKEKGKKGVKAKTAKAPEAIKPIPILQKEHVQPPKAADLKPADKGTDTKSDEVAKPEPSKTIEKKGGEATNPPAKVSAPEKVDIAATAPVPVESIVPAPEKKEGEPAPAKQDEALAKPPEKAGPATPEPEKTTAVTRPPDTPPAGIIKPLEPEQPKPEVIGAKKPAVVKEEKANPKSETPDKKSAGKKPEPLLSAVTFENTANKGEMVLFKLNEFYAPAVFGIEKGEPSVVCDFLNTRLADQVKDIIHTNGKFVQSVRITKHTKPNKIRVVLNLVPNRNYDLQQVFFKEDNLFVIIVNSSDNRPAGNPTTTQ